jgi:hypothetical protein
MRVQAMIAQADSKADGDPVQRQRDQENLPAETEQSRDCTDVK